MELQIVHPHYRCKEKELIMASIQAWENYMRHVVNFKKFSPYYSEDRAIHQLAIINEVQKKYFDSKEKNSIDSEQIKLQCIEVSRKWQLLKRYIQGAYPKKYHASKLVNAGKDFYFTAYRFNYDDMKSLIESSTNFLKNYKVILQLDDNMPASFYEEYIEATLLFNTLYDEYKVNKEQSKSDKYDKIDALNKIYKPLVEMLHDAKAIFIDDKKLLNLFSFYQLYEENIVKD
jgi:hypothetical protein